MVTRGDVVEASYLRFPLTITDREVQVRTPDGRRLATVRSIAVARRVVRGYRRAGRQG